MRRNRKNIEIMAPVGSYESLQAAIQAGADAVYFGIEKLNMRARSSVNFQLDDLEKIISICKENHIQTYLTVNTVIYDHEMEQMKQIVDTAHGHGITAIIASDLAVIQYARFVGAEVHISTQCNVSNLEAVKFYSQFADVMVLARELDLNQIRDICWGIKKEGIRGPGGSLVRIEIFVHGALCMSVSGKCYLSLHEYNHSANRGSCLQTCRRGYTVKDKETGSELDIENEYIMSPKDLCTIHFLNKILDAGVTVLKIEGRARSAEYVKTVVSCYNEAINAWVEGQYSDDKVKTWEKRLATVFNRGFWGGYYLGKKSGEWSHVYGSLATRKKIYIAKCTNYFDNLQVAEFQLETGELSAGEEIIILGPTTGVVEMVAKDIRVGRVSVPQAKKGDRFSLQTGILVRRNDKLYRVVTVPNDRID